MSFFLDRAIRHSGWYPDYVLRLFLREKGHYRERELGSSPVIEGTVGRLKGTLFHHPYKDLDEYFIKFNAYRSLHL